MAGQPAVALMDRPPAPLHIGPGQAELPGLRWLDASLEGRANSVQFTRRQMHGNCLDLRLVRGAN
jgi:hypothetical protein